MTQQDIITQLIVEDLKYYQFLHGLEQYNITLEYQPDLAPIIAQLLGVPLQQISDEWVDTYNHYMQMARRCAYHDTVALKEVAKWCLKALGEV